jgi:hypothetical protein
MAKSAGATGPRTGKRKGTESTGPDDDGRNRLNKPPIPHSTNPRDDGDNKKRKDKKGVRDEATDPGSDAKN